MRPDRNIENYFKVIMKFIRIKMYVSVVEEGKKNFLSSEHL